MPDDLEHVTILGDSPGGGYSFQGLDGETYHGKPSLVGGHRPGARECVGFLSPGGRREPVILTGPDTPRGLPHAWLFSSKPWVRGLWTQAEGQPELSNGQFLMANAVDWSVVQQYVDFSTPGPPNSSYLHRGYVIWTADVGVLGALAHWVQDSGDWYLAITIGPVGHQAQTVLLDKYTIADVGGAISQGGVTYGGGLDHGCLGLHYSVAQDALILFGPLTHPDGRLRIYHCSLATGQVTRSVSPVPLIHASLGHTSILLGYWGSSAEATGAESDYYRGDNLRLLKCDVAGRWKLASTISATSLANGNNYLHGCTPNGRARSRWPWRPSDQRFFVFVASGDRQAIPLEGDYHGATVIMRPSTVTDFTAQRFDVCSIGPNGEIGRGLSGTITASGQTSINYDSLDWLDSLRPGYSSEGWALTDGVVPTVVTDLSNTSGPNAGKGISWGPLNNKLPEQIFLHPLTSRNPYPDSGVVSDVFEWSPGGTTCAGMSISEQGTLVLVRSEPQAELYQSLTLSNAIAFCLEDHTVVTSFDTHDAGKTYITPSWQMPARRSFYQTFLRTFQDGGGVQEDVDISQYFTGLLDGPVQSRDPDDGHLIDNYRAYEARPILDMVWQAQVLDSGPGYSQLVPLYHIALLRDWRTQLDSGPSEARPVLNLHDPESGELVVTIDLVDEDYHPAASDGPNYANWNYAVRPEFKWGLDPNGYPFIDVFVHFRTRDTSNPIDTVGTDPTTCSITMIRWDADHPDLASPNLLPRVDIANYVIPEQSLDGLIYFDGKALLQRGVDAVRFDL